MVSNDTPSKDGGTKLYSFTYTNASGETETHTFVQGTDEVSVQTPTGALTVNVSGVWEFTPASSYDHDATGANADAGSFSYVLVDADGSQSNSADQPIRIADTNPTVNAVSLAIAEKDIKDIGSDRDAVDNTVTQALSITKAQDDIADVLFNDGTVSSLTSQGLTSSGRSLEYALGTDGHTLTASADGNTVFVLQVNHPGNVSGATQSISMTLHRPLDHGNANDGTNTKAIEVSYQVKDIDSSVNGALTISVTDDTPLNPTDETLVTVVENGEAVGSANGGANLLANDNLGADGGRVYDISYTNASGNPATIVIPDNGSENVATQYGSLTVHSDGTWTYTPVASANHVKPTHDGSVSDDFSYRVIDRDGDISSHAATQPITVTDTVPTIGTPDAGSVDEAQLPLGSAPNADNEPVQVSGTLDVTKAADAIDTKLTTNAAPAGLQSGGENVVYYLSTDGHTLTAYKGTVTAGNEVFTVALTDPTSASAGYTFTLLGTLDHPYAATDLPLDFGVTVTDSDGDVASATIKVTVKDDQSVSTRDASVAEDGSVSFNTSADATPANTTILQSDSPLLGNENGQGGKDYKTTHGTVTVNADGTITYKPDANFSGTEEFEYQTVDGGKTDSTTVTMTVNPLSDPPTIPAFAPNIHTLEDTAVALGLEAPVVKDDGTGDGNNVTSERLGVVTLSGIPNGAVLTADMLDGTTAISHSATDDDITIVLSDSPTVDGATGTLTMTKAQFEALKVLPPADSHANFTVTMKESSFEVDAGGNPLAGIGGAESFASVKVHVQAVTDDVALTFDTGNTTAAVTIKEDSSFNARDILLAAFADLDGSEVRSFTIGNPAGNGDIFVNGTKVAAGGSITVHAPALSTSTTGLPDITIKAADDFSGDLNSISITLNAQDKDADGHWDGSSVTGVGGNGVEEANTDQYRHPQPACHASGGGCGGQQSGCGS